MSNTKKNVFSIIGEFKDTQDRGRRFIPDSPAYYHDRCSKQPLKIKYTCTFSKRIPTRSEAQLDYHWVLCEYISEHTGYSPEEVHQLSKQLVFGTEEINIGKYRAIVCKSIADRAMLPKYEMVELIQKDLEICQENDIVVPTSEELGYIKN